MLNACHFALPLMLCLPGAEAAVTLPESGAAITLKLNY